MNRGDKFNVAGYDVTASIQVVHGSGNPEEGEILVLNNNSTHYLVAAREPGKPYAYLVLSYRYDDAGGELDEAEYEEVAKLAYEAALDHAVELAKSR